MPGLEIKDNILTENERINGYWIFTIVPMAVELKTNIT